MKRIAYLLHNFPGITDTFIKREIRSLQALGTDVCVISVWKPSASQTTQEILTEWCNDTEFLLPRSSVKIVYSLITEFARKPIRFLKTLLFAYRTSRPGLRGIAYQMFYFCEAVLAANVLREKQITHLHNHIGDQSGTVTLLAASLCNIAYSITFHGWPVFFDTKYSGISEKVKFAAFTRAISYFCQSQLMMFSKCDDPKRYEVIHCGLKMNKYPYRKPKERIDTLFCAARLSPEKGIAFLIKAIKELVDEGFELTLRLAGNGPSKKELEALTRKLGISRNVEFLGFLNEEQVIKELIRSDLFVLPSFVEGVPVCVMEAMAVGVPVIATNIAGTSELIDDEKSGLLVRPSDVRALAEAIRRMIVDYKFRLIAAEAARKKVVAEFDVDKETKKLNECMHREKWSG